MPRSGSSRRRASSGSSSDRGGAHRNPRGAAAGGGAGGAPHPRGRPTGRGAAGQHAGGVPPPPQFAPPQVDPPPPQIAGGADSPPQFAPPSPPQNDPAPPQIAGGSGSPPRIPSAPGSPQIAGSPPRIAAGDDPQDVAPPPAAGRSPRVIPPHPILDVIYPDPPTPPSVSVDSSPEPPLTGPARRLGPSLWAPHIAVILLMQKERRQTLLHHRSTNFYSRMSKNVFAHVWPEKCRYYYLLGQKPKETARSPHLLSPNPHGKTPVPHSITRLHEISLRDLDPKTQLSYHGRRVDLDIIDVVDTSAGIVVLGQDGTGSVIRVRIDIPERFHARDAHLEEKIGFGTRISISHPMFDTYEARCGRRMLKVDMHHNLFLHVETDRGSCRYCSKPHCEDSGFECAGCNGAFYCSKKCWQYDWQVLKHYLICGHVESARKQHGDSDLWDATFSYLGGAVLVGMLAFYHFCVIDKPF